MENSVFVAKYIAMPTKKRTVAIAVNDALTRLSIAYRARSVGMSKTSATTPPDPCRGGQSACCAERA